ncbi:MAG TPA: T9SS type A sorting domain-containing protein [Chitinophagaceae bacterium]|nr:T9SS type A sorting domain-containing protein [Chitinophagaceae bacterium]
MKTFINRINSTSCLFVLALSIITNKATSQTTPPPIYKFQNPTLVSGTGGTVNATYRFPSVAPGVDALVKITNMAGGITLVNIDRTADGYGEAFQPEYQVPAASNGYIDFRIIFVAPGNSTPKEQALVDCSGLDIDGSLYSGVALKEYNNIDLHGGICTFNLLNSEIAVSQNGTGFLANNITGNLFGTLVDTAATQVMYSVRNQKVDTFYYRVGANNLLPGVVPRYASLYFKRFLYPTTGVLSVNSLAGFSGVSQNNEIKLQWSLSEGNNARNIVLEKSATANGFYPTAEFPVNQDGKIQQDFDYTDNRNVKGSVFYRLKITAADGRIQYSNVLHFQNGGKDESVLNVFPTVVQSTATVNINVPEKQNAVLSITDMAGRIVKQILLALQEGNNSLLVSGIDRFQKGNYIVSVNTGRLKLSSQIVVQ